MHQSAKKGFTLIELLIVILILGVLTSLISGSFFSSLKKGRDARRKTDLGLIQKGLELYYEDNRSYPTSITLDGTGQLCYPGAGGCTTKIYINKIPDDPSTGCDYVYSQKTAADGSAGYALYSAIENSNDNGPGTKQAGYSPTCGSCGTCKFAIGSANVSP